MRGWKWQWIPGREKVVSATDEFVVSAQPVAWSESRSRPSEDESFRGKTVYVVESRGQPVKVPQPPLIERKDCGCSYYGHGKRPTEWVPCREHEHSVGVVRDVGGTGSVESLGSSTPTYVASRIARHG